MKRSELPKQSTPVKRRNAQRQRREFARAYGSHERVEWVRWLGSIVDGERPCENVHVRTGGAGRKANACWIVPLTHDQHALLHTLGKATFEQRYGVDFDAHAARIAQLWDASQPPESTT